MAGNVPKTIILAMGAGALGGPEALRLLLAFAGQSPLLDVVVAVFVVGAVTAPVLGTMLMARFFRKERAGAGAGGGALGAAAMDRFAVMTLVVAFAVVFSVGACLLVVPSVETGGLSLLQVLFAFAEKSPLVVAAAAAVAAAVIGAATGSVRDTIPLSRFFRKAHNDFGATERFAKTILLVSFIITSLVGVWLLVVPSLAAGCLDAHRVFRGFAGQNPLVGVTTAIVVGTTLLLRFFRKAQNAAGAGAPTPATELFAKMTVVTLPLAVAFFIATCLLVTPCPGARRTRPSTHALPDARAFACAAGTAGLPVKVPAP